MKFFRFDKQVNKGFELLEIGHEFVIQCIKVHFVVP